MEKPKLKEGPHTLSEQGLKPRTMGVMGSSLPWTDTSCRNQVMRNMCAVRDTR